MHVQSPLSQLLAQCSQLLYATEGGPGPPLCGFLQLRSVCRKFETFQDDTGAFPGSPPGTLAGEPGAHILWTQDSSTDLLPSKFAMPA